MMENEKTTKDPELATAPLRIHPSVNVLVSLFSNEYTPINYMYIKIMYMIVMCSTIWFNLVKVVHLILCPPYRTIWFNLVKGCLLHCLLLIKLIILVRQSGLCHRLERVL